VSEWDVAIIGAGIAGAGLADALASYRKVILLESEAQPGYHSTGRSAAFWSETYGGPDIQPLTSASGAFLTNPPAEYHDCSFLTARGALHIGTQADHIAADEMSDQFAKSCVRLEPVSPDNMRDRIAGLRANWSLGLWEPDCSDIDVAALHSAYLRAARRKGAVLRCASRVTALRYRNNIWDVETASGAIRAHMIVNAAGAWSDQIAVLAGVAEIPIRPHRRTVLQLEVEPAASPDLPLVVGLDGSFYFKSVAGGRVWLSPHDETPSLACDAVPDEMDVAQAIHRFEQVVDSKVKRLEHKWAGLRSFAPDRLPVVGRDTSNPDFFWLVGQGGFGIQTAPAVSQMAAAQIVDGLSCGEAIDPARYRPGRF
jgi:D-arginine dehydrogenase